MSDMDLLRKRAAARARLAAEMSYDGSHPRQDEASARVSLPTIKRLEAKGVERSAVATAQAVRSALEGAGVQFLAAGDGAQGSGVALR